MKVQTTAHSHWPNFHQSKHLIMEPPKITINEGFKEPQLTTRIQNHRKVGLEPGYTLGGWAKLNLQNQFQKGLIPTSEIKKHNKRDDAWTVYRGKVYDMTAYISYHPGGVDMIMLGAGRDCTILYDKYHQWVNAEAMLSKCFIGYPMVSTPTRPTQVVCKSVTQLSQSIKAFTFESARPLMIVPGQYVTFAVKVNLHIEYRNWTVTSVKGSVIEIILKKQGLATSWMHNSLEVGSRMNILEIDGEFTSWMLKEIPPKLLFISAGIGITPMLAMLRVLCNLDKGPSITMIQSERDSCAFSEELNGYVKDGKLDLTILSTQKDGRLSLEMLEKLSPDIQERDVYLCGPNDFMTTIAGYCGKLGAKSVKTEYFDY